VALIFDIGPTDLVGNYIGTDATGSLARGNGGSGVLIISANNQVLDNLISANQGDGIDLVGPSATGNLIQGNLIGTDAAGTADLGNDGDGIDITGEASANMIGGIMPGQGNVIAFNGGNGVLVADEGTVGNTISGNALFDNGELGIDLNDDGPTPNDPLDADASPNNLQNTPVLAKIVQGAAQTVILGSIHSTPRTHLRIELFANAADNLLGSGGGRRFLGHVDVRTNRKGRAAISFRLPGRLAAGEVVTATATNLTTGDTSEFSAGLQVLGIVRGTKYIDRNGNGVINRGEPGLGGVTIFADLNDNGVLDDGDVSTVSRANGSFTLLIPQDGTIAIREVVPIGFQQTTPDRLVTIAGANVVNRVLIGNQRVPAVAAAREFDVLLWTSLPLSRNTVGGWAHPTQR
jgi:hypothetical protein